MRAAIMRELGSSDRLVTDTIDDPVAGPGQLRIRVAATGLGFVDGLLASGKYQVKPPVPFIPGNEIAGHVDTIGDGVSGFAVGDPVMATCFGGGLAELCIVDAAVAHPLPVGLAPAIAAALPINYATALHALKDRAGIAPGETLLVIGAAGGTGAAAVEVGKRLGARVIACASTAEKRDVATRLGADSTLASDAPEWRNELRAITGGRGVDVVFDPAGDALFEPAFRSLTWRGRYLVVGFAGGAIPALPANLALLKGAALVGVDLRQFGQFEPDRAYANLTQVLDWAAAGALTVPIGARFSLAQAAAAMAATTDRATWGKIVVTIAD